jgi:hypothetical protein
MKKLQQDHMEAVGEIANSVAVNQMIEALDGWMDQLPPEFEKAKESFKELKFNFENGIAAAINKYVEDSPLTAISKKNTYG